MSLHNWIKRRELGLKPKYGDSSSFYKNIYTSFASFEPFSCINFPTAYEYGGLYNLEFSPDGRILVAACEKRSLIFYDPQTSHQIKTIDDAHLDCVNCIKFIDSRLFATCSDDQTVALWDTRNLKQKIRTLNGHSNWVKNIEYSGKNGRLVTSGFDGAIFSWDIKSHTELGYNYEKIFQTSGLMRCKISRDETKMVICTTSGYLVIVHNLDLQKFAEDLQSFQPSLYRLMQMGRQYIPIAGATDHVFTNERNRVELIADFPKGNEAEIISSLQIHPQGWCAVSRNLSYDESSEWTCVHDIQEIDAGEFPMTKPVPIYKKVTPPLPVQLDSPNSHPDIWQGELAYSHRRHAPNTPSNVNPIVSGVIEQECSVNGENPRVPKDPRIRRNIPRLIGYIREKNVGQGFIKEMCFSPDGRVICSPYEYGFRLLGFNAKCDELPDTLDAKNQTSLFDLVQVVQCHKDVVVSTKFSPTQPLLVSGCLKGKLVWHQPIF